MSSNILLQATIATLAIGSLLFYRNRPKVAKGVDFDPNKDIPDLSGKVILVTGGNTGLGYASIHHLSKHNPRKIYLAARTPSKAHAAISELKKDVPDANIEFLQLDLGSLKSVKEAAETFKRKENRLDILMNNAGVMALAEGLTEDGYEIQFGTNHMGHFLLTSLLLPTLLQTSQNPSTPARIISLSSRGHRFAPRAGISFPTLRTPMPSSLTWTRYGQSKIANILHAAELARRYPAITSVSLHPGSVSTELDRAFRERLGGVARWFGWIRGLIQVGVEEGVKGQLWACGVREGELRNGGYYTPVGVLDERNRWVEDEEMGRELWEWCERELEEKGF